MLNDQRGGHFVNKIMSLITLTVLVSACSPHGNNGRKAKKFEEMDKDSNGEVSTLEWQKYHKSKFQNKEKNKDGVLTKDEITKKKIQKKYNTV